MSAAWKQTVTTVRILQRFETAAQQRRVSEDAKLLNKPSTDVGRDRLIDGVIASHLKSARGEGTVKLAITHRRAGKIEYVPAFEAAARHQLAAMRTPMRPTSGVPRSAHGSYLSRPAHLAPLQPDRRPCSAPACSPTKNSALADVGGVARTHRAASVAAGALGGLHRGRVKLPRRRNRCNFVQAAAACLVAMRLVRRYMLKRHGRTHRNLLVAAGRFSGAGSLEQRRFDESVWRRPGTSNRPTLRARPPPLVHGSRKGGAGRVRFAQTGDAKTLQPLAVTESAVLLSRRNTAGGRPQALRSALDHMDAAAARGSKRSGPR